MAKRRNYRRDRRGRFATVAGAAAARRLGGGDRRPKRSSTSISLSAGSIQTRRVQLNDVGLTLQRSRTVNAAPAKKRRKN